MGKRYESVLEKYDAKGNRRLPTPEEEALSPVYPEEYLLGGTGKAVASGFKNLVKRPPPRKVEVPPIGSQVDEIEFKARLREQMSKEDWAKSPWGRNPFEPTAEEAARAAKKATIDKAKEMAAGSFDRATRNFSRELGWDVGSDMASGRRTNAAGDTYKKGGKVKKFTASSRGDGIAQRGKTKGRMV